MFANLIYPTALVSGKLSVGYVSNYGNYQTLVSWLVPMGIKSIATD